MRILIIQLKQIGDVLLSTPLCTTLRQKYPDAIIDYAVSDFTAGVVQHHPHISNLIILDSNQQYNPVYLFKLWRQIRRNKYDVVIDVIAKLGSSMMTFLSGAPLRIGFDKRIRRLVYNNIVSQKTKRAKPISGAGNTIDDRLSLLFGIDSQWNFSTEIKTYLSLPEITNIASRMSACGINFKKAKFAFGVTSRREYRVWPHQYYIELINRLVERYDCQILFYYTPNEKEYCLKIAKEIKNQAMVFANVDAPNIRELAALLKNCDLYIGNDTGAKHIAQSVGTPTFTIYSPASNKQSFNPHNNARHVAVDYRDALQITPEEFAVISQKITKKNAMLYFAAIKPDFVYYKACEMIDNIILPDMMINK